METALVVLIVVVAFVAIDVLRYADWRPSARSAHEARPSTGKIVVDLTGRDTGSRDDGGDSVE